MRETRRNHYLSPATGDDAEAVLDDALVTLGSQRRLSPGDAGVTLHLLTSLTAQAERRLPRAVADARDQDYSWAQIADLLGTTRASAWQRFATPAQPARATHDDRSEPEPPMA